MFHSHPPMFAIPGALCVLIGSVPLDEEVDCHWKCTQPRRNWRVYGHIQSSWFGVRSLACSERKRGSLLEYGSRAWSQRNDSVLLAETIWESMPFVASKFFAYWRVRGKWKKRTMEDLDVRTVSPRHERFAANFSIGQVAKCCSSKSE